MKRHIKEVTGDAILSLVENESEIKRMKEVEWQKKEDFKEAFNLHLIRYNENELRMVVIRQQSTLFIFIIIGFSIILMYPSELLNKYNKVLGEKQAIFEIIFYMNWAGIYHHWEPR